MNGYGWIAYIAAAIVFFILGAWISVLSDILNVLFLNRGS
jgi:hypothetical protein